MHIINQYKYCSDMKNNFCLNAVIKFENLNNDLNKISTKLFDKQDMLKHLINQNTSNIGNIILRNLKTKFTHIAKRILIFLNMNFDEISKKIIFKIFII